MENAHKRSANIPTQVPSSTASLSLPLLPWASTKRPQDRDQLGNLDLSDSYRGHQYDRPTLMHYTEQKQHISQLRCRSRQPASCPSSSFHVSIFKLQSDDSDSLLQCTTQTPHAHQHVSRPTGMAAGDLRAQHRTTSERQVLCNSHDHCTLRADQTSGLPFRTNGSARPRRDMGGTRRDGGSPFLTSCSGIRYSMLLMLLRSRFRSGTAGAPPHWKDLVFSGTFFFLFFFAMLRCTACRMWVLLVHRKYRLRTFYM